MSLVDVEDDTLTQVTAIKSFCTLPSEGRFEDMAHVLCRGSKKSRQRIVRALGRAAKWMGGIDTVWALCIPDRESDKASLEAHLSTYPSYSM